MRERRKEPRYNFDVIRKNNFLLIRALKNFEIDIAKGPTAPYGLFLTHDGVVVTIMSMVMPPLENLIDTVSRHQIDNGWFLVLEILHVIFKQMDQLAQKVAKMIREIQPRLMQSHNVADIRQPFELNNYLIFFNTAIIGNASTLKSFYSRYKNVFEANMNLFEKYDDVQTDIDQTIQFFDIYRGVLSNSLDAFASVINNNFTSVMKIVGSLTLISALPMMIASFYGMNVRLPGDVDSGNNWTWLWILIVSVLVCFIAYKIFRDRHWI